LNLRPPRPERGALQVLGCHSLRAPMLARAAQSGLLIQIKRGASRRWPRSPRAGGGSSGPLPCLLCPQLGHVVPRGVEALPVSDASAWAAVLVGGDAPGVAAITHPDSEVRSWPLAARMMRMSWRSAPVRIMARPCCWHSGPTRGHCMGCVSRSSPAASAPLCGLPAPRDREAAMAAFAKSWRRQ
jgi:hypothetical protein